MIPIDGFRDTTAPDSDRLWLGIGATYQKSKTSRLDIAFNQVFFRPANIALTRGFFAGTPLATVVGIKALGHRIKGFLELQPA